MRRRMAIVTLLILIAIGAGDAGAVTIGQIDTFQNGTTLGWTAGGGPFGQTPPVPPFVTMSGGPAGIDDAYLTITSQGGQGPGSRLTAFNISGQWSGNYLTSGIAAIAVDLRNLGSTELTIRLEFENPFAGGDEAVTNTGIVLSPGSDWTHAIFPIGLGSLTSLEGTVRGALTNTSVLRIIHAPGLTDSAPIAGVLGVDNVAAVPEPATSALIAAALLAVCTYRRSR
jgi:hypothetical protein